MSKTKTAGKKTESGKPMKDPLSRLPKDPPMKGIAEAGAVGKKVYDKGVATRKRLGGTELPSD